jgi:hypothetical protein
MQRDRRNLRGSRLGAGAIGALLTLAPQASRADESGVSFWLPGQVDSLPAVPAAPVAGPWLLSIITPVSQPPAPLLRRERSRSAGSRRPSMSASMRT